MTNSSAFRSLEIMSIDLGSRRSEPYESAVPRNVHIPAIRAQGRSDIVALRRMKAHAPRARGKIPHIMTDAELETDVMAAALDVASGNKLDDSPMFFQAE